MYVAGSSTYGGRKLTAQGPSLTQAVNFPSAIPRLVPPRLLRPGTHLTT